MPDDLTNGGWARSLRIDPVMLMIPQMRSPYPPLWHKGLRGVDQTVIVCMNVVGTRQCSEVQSPSA